MSSPNHQQSDQIPPITSDSTKTATSYSGSGHAFRPILPKPKAPRTAARTTLKQTDRSNFAAVVRQLTGCSKSQEHPVREHAQQQFRRSLRNTNTRGNGDNSSKRPTEEKGNPVNTLSSSYKGEKSKDNDELIRDPSPDNTSSTSSALVEFEVQEEETINPTREGTYEVYLSFSDETHKNFADFLYYYLVDVGIRIFEENIDLRFGKDTDPVFINYSAIKESKISIPVFSKNYASSTRCMHELTHMVHCHITDGQKILPIFYDVEPKQVQNQLGSYREAFRQHETTYDEKTLQEWKVALIKVANMPGFVLHKRYEGELIKNVAKNILSKLDSNFMDLPEDLIGMDHHIKEMKRLLHVNSRNVFIVGIHGRGGIGKTTITKVIYNKFCEQFECSCFLENVRELLTLNNGLINLQSQLLSKIKGEEVPNISNVDEGIYIIQLSLFRKKVLIVLDDVDEKFRFDKLVGKCELFGSGSRIIVTTRYKEVLDQLKVICQVRIYEPRLMNPHDSLHLFSKYAFMSEFPPEDYDILSKEIVSIAGGIPSVLVSTGTLLFGKEDKDLWEEILRKIKKLHEKDNIVKLTVNPKELDGEEISFS